MTGRQCGRYRAAVTVRSLQCGRYSALVTVQVQCWSFLTSESVSAGGGSRLADRRQLFRETLTRSYRKYWILERKHVWCSHCWILYRRSSEKPTKSRGKKSLNPDHLLVYKLFLMAKLNSHYKGEDRNITNNLHRREKSSQFSIRKKLWEMKYCETRSKKTRYNL